MQAVCIPCVCGANICAQIICTETISTPPPFQGEPGGSLLRLLRLTFETFGKKSRAAPGQALLRSMAIIFMKLNLNVARK